MKNKSKNFINKQFYLRSLKIVYNFLQNEEKALAWFEAKNPILGMLSPNQLVIMGRAKKSL